VVFLAHRVPEQLGIGLLDHGGEAEVLGVVGDDQEVQGTDQAGPHAARGDDHLPLGEAERLVGTQPVADHAGVGGVGRVEVGISPEDAVRVGLVEIGRVLLFSDLDVFLVDGEVLSSRRGAEQHRESHEQANVHERLLPRHSHHRIWLPSS